MQIEYQLMIREHHLDSFGHVNNATYMEIYEEARWDFITSNGYSLDYVKSSQKGPVIIEAQIQYRKELKNRDEIKVVSKLISHHVKLTKMEQSIIKANGDIASIAIFTFGLLDLKERKLIEPTPEWRKAIGLDQHKT